MNSRTFTLCLTSTYLALLAVCLPSATAQRFPPKHIIVVDATTMNHFVVDATTGTLVNFLDTSNATEIRVVNRKFLTTFNVSVTSNKVAAPIPIRDLEEAASMTLGPGTLIPIAKGAGDITPLTPHTTSEIFLLLVDESTSEQPRTMLESDYQELVTETATLTAKLAALTCQYQILRGAAGLGCGNGGSVNLTSVISALTNENAWATGTPQPGRPAPFLNPPFQTGEQTFVMMNVFIADRLAEVSALQAAITQADLATAATRLDTGLTQYEKNLDTFRGSLRAMQSAYSLFDKLKVGDLTTLRRAQLKIHLAGQLKTQATDPASTLDQTELDVLVESYIRSLGTLAKTTGTAPNIRVRDFGDEVDCIQRNLEELPVTNPPSNQRCSTLTHGIRFSTPATFSVQSSRSLRAGLTQIQIDVNKTIPTLVAQVNGLQRQLVQRANFIYDNSRLGPNDPQIIHLNLKDFPGNQYIYFAVQYTEGYARYVPQTSLTSAGLSNVTVGVALPPAAGTPVPIPAAAPAVASAATEPALRAAVNATHVPIIGPVEIHEFQSAAVIAAAAFSTIRSNNYATRVINFTNQPTTGPCIPVTTTSGGTTTTTNTTCYESYRTTSEVTPQVMIGVMYYVFQLHDSFPDNRQPWQGKTGVVLGVSANRANNFFVGLAHEPIVGVNIGVGVQFGAETRLQDSVLQLNQMIGTTAPTTTVRVQKPYVSIGLDLNIFRKVYGKIFGIGHTS